MPRAKKASDAIYNARRRYTRQADRYSKMADRETGAAAARYRELAKSALSKADELRKDLSQKPSAAFSRLADKLGFEPGRKQGASEERIRSLEEQSRRLSGNLTDTRRENEAKAILNNTNIGSRLYAGLKDIWQGADDINQAIMDYFGVESMMDVLQRIEEAGIDIYQDAGDRTIYDTVRMQLELQFRPENPPAPSAVAVRVS